jgi:hypothetical protein
MATMLEEYTTEDERSFVRFCGKRESMQRMFIKNIACLWWEVFVV